MKCVNCGYECEQDFLYCAACGAPVQPPVQPSFSVNPAAAKLLPAFKDGMFLAICILLTVSAALALIGGSVQLIVILTVIFMWQIFAAARKDVVDVNNMRNVSGAVYANYVIQNVVWIIMAVCGVIFAGAFSYIADNQEAIDMLYDELGTIDESVSVVLQTIFDLSGWLIAAVFIVLAVIALVINIVGYRKLHRLAKSAYQSVEGGDVNLIRNANATKNWMWLFGICSAVSGLDSLSAETALIGLSTLCSAAACIIAAIMVKKYLLTAAEPVETIIE
jgi:hypothetical protein